MTEGYEPPSDFLKGVINESVPLGGSSFGRANFLRLIEMMRDSDTANRDWATLLLAQSDFDDDAVRSALLVAADDADPVVRAEAIHGLAMRIPEQAQPLVYRELQNDIAYPPIMEAASLVCDPSLIEHIRPFAEGDDWVAQLARDAVEVCSRNGG